MNTFRELAVWLTYAKTRSQVLADFLRAQGAQVLQAPTIQLVPLTPDERLLPATAAMIIFVSPQAVHFGLPFLPVTLLHQTLIAGVGSSTCLALADYGMLAALRPQGQEGSEGLLALSELSQVQGKHIIIVAGQGGRTLLAETLTARGAHVHTLLCYARQMPTIDLTLLHQHQVSGRQHVIVVTSATALHNVLALLPTSEHAYWQQQTLLVVSARIAVIAQQLGFRGEIINASGANNAALMTALMNRYGNNESAH